MLWLPPDPVPHQPVRAQTIAAILRYLRQITPRSSAHMRVKVGSGGATFDPIFRPQTPSTSIGGIGTFPFQVTTRANPTSPDTYQARVEYNSSLSKSMVLDDRQTITGLTTYNEDGSVADSSWFNFDQGNDLIYLEITLDGSGGSTAATIQSWGLGGTWAPHDPPSEYGTGTGEFEYQLTYDDASNKIFTQYLARIAIFSSVTSPSGAFAVTNTQLLNTNLLLTADVYSGPLYQAEDGPATIGVVMPKPFAGPFVQTS